MKLIFKKDEQSQISVLQSTNCEEREFSYVDMIKALIESRKMEEPQILGDFTAAEVASIKRMIEFINKEVATCDENGKEDEEEQSE